MWSSVITSTTREGTLTLVLLTVVVVFFFFLLYSYLETAKTQKITSGEIVEERTIFRKYLLSTTYSMIVSLTNGVELYVDQRNEESSPALLFLHGWPSLSISWRHQMRFFAELGYRVISYDSRGCGRSSRPASREEYGQRQLCRDAQLLLEHLGVDDVITVGHDWGGVTNWHLALSPEDVSFNLIGLVSLNTPFSPYAVWMADPPLTGVYDYQRYLQDSARASQELNADIARSISAMIRPEELAPSSGVVARGGLFVGVPDPLPENSILSPQVLAQYAEAYNGDMTASLHVYNNYAANAAYRKETQDVEIKIPVLMMTAGKDRIQTPESSQHMDGLLVNLTRAHLPESSHWTMEQFPEEVNQFILKFIIRQQQS